MIPYFALDREFEALREPIMGLMRLQWWRDSLGEIYAGRTRDHASINMGKPLMG